ncbi:MAG: aspartate kinase [Bacteroidia bacterium]|nr:MAG: aspartate kinase [Bacteroidia bacterium]
MRVFKFGGASVKDPKSVRNVAEIIKHQHDTGPLVIVLSAMGKTTNALELLCAMFMERNKTSMMAIFDQLKTSHLQVAKGLFSDPNHPVFSVLEQSFYQLYYYITEEPGNNYNYEYDRIVSTGEMVSTQILSAYLKEIGLHNYLFNAQKLVITDANFRDARVDWIMSTRNIREKLLPFLTNIEEPILPPLVITQGFIGGTTQGFTTTLGREGSDFTAAIIAYALDASEVVIWKDVAGLLNADPKILRNTLLLNNISYQEAIELAYYGATVIHPKTLKPLLSKNIPLRVKSFEQPNKAGSLINQNETYDNLVPSYIFKYNQVLVSIFPMDFSFIAEENLSRIFADFARHGVRMNLMQNSAISFSACFDRDKTKTPALLKDLKKNFHVKHNSNLELVTVRHYGKANIDELVRGREVLLEQKSRTTLQLVVKNDASTSCK